MTETSELSYIPKRIISLVPSQTELLHDLGLEQETVGITRFCVHPAEWFRTKTRIGGTKTIHPGIIHQLKPDLIIANREENLKEQIELLAKDYPVWVTDVNNLNRALAMISDIGKLTGKYLIAETIIERISDSFRNLSLTRPPVKTAYLIWRKPYMITGEDTFINDMLLKCGFKNVFAGKIRYPEISISELQNSNCQLLILSSEPYPFKQKHVDELKEQLPGCKIILADGEFFSWYGSRLLAAPDYFRKFINSVI